MPIQLKRIYEKPAQSDGFRVFVERLWPRGLSKQSAHFDLWSKELAPSPALRKWFNHDPAKWEQFKTRYFLELDTQPAATAALIERAQHNTVTLLFASKELRYNSAAALKQYCEQKPPRSTP